MNRNSYREDASYRDICGRLVLPFLFSKVRQATKEREVKILLQEYSDPYKHVLFHHSNADGFITLAKKESDRFKQYHYKPDEIQEQLSSWLGEDVYFSQNTFYMPNRRIENIRQLRSLFVDVDCHLFNMNPEWLVQQFEQDLFKQQIPEPNIIIFSGRGLNLIWLIEPVPSQALPLWQAIQEYLCKKFEETGGDSKALDASRIFRVAGSINSKNGNQVYIQHRHDYRYTLRDIQEEYLPELPDHKPHRRSKAGRPSKILHLHNVRTLHYARTIDIVKLIELRDRNMTGYREMTFFLYRYWQCCLLSDEQEALRQTLELNEGLMYPLPKREVEKATRSAEKAWNEKNNDQANRAAIKNGYPGAGYNVTNKKLIEWLDITLEEQKHLKTIIGRGEKYRRNNERREQLRRQQGIIERSEYLTRAKNRREQAYKLYEQGLTNQEIASELNMSKRHVIRIIGGDM